MQNPMEEKMENEMEAGVIGRLYRDPSIQIIPTLGPKVCKYYLHWAIWIPREGIANYYGIFDLHPVGRPLRYMQSIALKDKPW